MNGIVFLGINWPSFVDGLSNHIDNSAQSLRAHWNHNGISGVFHTLSSHQPVSLIQRNRPHSRVAQVLSHFQNQTVVHSFNLSLFYKALF